MSYQTIGATTIANGVTTVDCQKQVRSWRLLRSIIGLLIPSCNCISMEEQETKQDQNTLGRSYHYPKSIFTSSTITGTFFGFRRGKVCFCIQASSKSINPILLLELAVPRTTLAKEMRGGILRIALESSSDIRYRSSENGSPCNFLLSMPAWTMYCNGRRVGYAVKRRPSKGDMDALRLMGSVDVGAGIISAKELDRDDELMYLRANFDRVCGSSDAESFHLIDPDKTIGQELSIFFFRKR